MVYKRVRGWTSGRSLPVLNFVKYPPGNVIEYGILSSPPFDSGSRIKGQWHIIPIENETQRRDRDMSTVSDPVRFVNP